MRKVILLFLFTLCTKFYLNAQSFELISECSDSIIYGPIENITILEPLVQHDVQVIKNVILSTVEKMMRDKINYRLEENDKYVTKYNNRILLDIRDLAKSQKEYDAILVIHHVLYQEIYDNSTPVDDSYNYSLIIMYLYNNKCELIAKSAHKSLTGDSMGITKKPLKGVESATKKSTKSILKEINDLNENLL